jgi:hypothetical protein
MAPKAFHRFRKLPIELRLRIWNLMIEPRVIRAKWDNDVTERDIVQVYILAAGAVPKVLHICKESREEAKRKYCFIKSHLQILDRKTSIPSSPKSIWANFDIDTLYFVNIPAVVNFLSYMRRLSKKKIGGADKNIKYIAFPACVLDRLRPFPGMPSNFTNFYRLVVDLPSIKKIIIMLDNSKFEDEKYPEHYSLSRPQPIGKNGKGGGRWGSKEIRDKLSLMFDDFFTNPKGEGNDIEAFKKYKDKHPDWVLPSFTILSITKTPKHDYAGDGLPVDKIPKKRVTARPKKTTKNLMTAKLRPAKPQ